MLQVDCLFRQHSGVVSDPNDVLLYFMISGKAVSDKLNDLFEIMKDILCHSQLNNQKRVIEMLKESKSRRESSVISSGNSYAAVRLGAK
jgi:Zn-dependent M16 (insulinase) family peptidase